MCPRPLIGITVNRDYNSDRYWLPAAYCSRIELAGGVPLLLPPSGTSLPAELLPGLSGILLSGGGDIAPLYFGEEPEFGLEGCDPQRDDWEIRLVHAALKQDLPLLGICRGLQLLNVAAGGSIVQHLSGPGLLQHMQKAPHCHPSHTAAVSPATRLATVAGEGCIAVNSFHHQAVCRPAPGLRVAAAAPDGVVEALESPTHRFILAVQWHPETLDHPSTDALFSAFVETAARLM